MSPGIDGFTAEFYLNFWELLGQELVDSLNYAFEIGELSISQKRGIITLIPKKDKNKVFLNNWRPISLLNTDYKIATKAITARIVKVLPSLIHGDQTGYIKGRFIGQNVRLIADENLVGTCAEELPEKPVCRPSVGCLSADCRPSVSGLLAYSKFSCS